jgi:hypothetical protein
MTMDDINNTYIFSQISSHNTYLNLESSSMQQDSASDLGEPGNRKDGTAEGTSPIIFRTISKIMIC